MNYPRQQSAEVGERYRILLQDYGGYPFVLQLAEVLAQRGHTVRHAFCSSNPSTPNAISDALDNSAAFESIGIALSKAITKGSFVERLRLERQYGARLARLIEDFRPDVVILANTPIDALSYAISATRRAGAALIVWVQDLLGEAALRILPTHIGYLGRAIGHTYRWREARLLANADHLIAITDDFRVFFDAVGIRDEHWTTIPNWAPLDRILPCKRMNDWSHEQGLDSKTVFLYSGSLGFKHNPKLLLSLARAFKDRDDAIVVVNSEGSAAEWLREKAAAEQLEECLRVNSYQPFDRISEVLGSADVLLALLEPDAGVFSVPSKVLSNHCAARPQLLAVPRENLAARIVRSQGSGVVCDPADEERFVAEAHALLAEPDRRESMGGNARRYATETFDIDRIAERFEEALVIAISNFSPKSCARNANAVPAASTRQPNSGLSRWVD